MNLIGSLDFSQPSITGRAKNVIARICAFVQRAGRAAASTVEARRNGVAALGRILQTCLAGNQPLLSAYLLQHIMTGLFG